MIFARADFAKRFNLCHPSDAPGMSADQDEQREQGSRLQNKLPCVDVARHDEERAVRTPTTVSRQRLEDTSATATNSTVPLPTSQSQP